MSFSLRVAKRAANQIRSAAEWWSRHRPKAPLAFADDIEESFALIRAVPGVGEPVDHPRIPELRRIYLARVRYHLYYSLDRQEEVVEVLALWHGSRGSKPAL